VVAAVWVVFFVVNEAIAFSLWFRHAIEKDNFLALATQLNAAYVTYLGAVIGFYVVLPKKKAGDTAMPRLNRTGALVATFLWNCAITAWVLPLAFGAGRIEDNVKFISYFAPLFSWIVAPIFTASLARDH
jgi:hypothetical protein